MRYDEFLTRLDGLGLTPLGFTKLAGISPNTAYAWKDRGPPNWASAIVRQQETIAFYRTAIEAFIVLAEQGRIDELKTHAAEIVKLPQWRTADA